MKKLVLLSSLCFTVQACSGGNDAADSKEVVEGEEVATETSAPAEAPAPAPQQASADPIRGPGGMEERCLDRVNEAVGGGVIGTNRIEEAESGVMIYVNVQGASAPWQCFGSRDGTISDVYFGGNEGAL